MAQKNQIPLSRVVDEIYDAEHARDFERHFAATPWGQYKIDRIAELLCRLVDMDDAEILEVGCGTGNLSWQLAAIGHNRVTGLDLSEHMLDVARSKSHDAGRSIRFVSGDTLKLPFPPASFDIVLERNLSPLLYQESWENGVAHTVLQEMQRVARRAVILMHQNRNVLTMSSPLKRYSKRELARRLEEAGFEPVECAYVTYSTSGLLTLLGERSMRLVERLMAATPLLKTLGGSVLAIGYVSVPSRQ